MQHIDIWFKFYLNLNIKFKKIAFTTLNIEACDDGSLLSPGGLDAVIYVVCIPDDQLQVVLGFSLLHGVKRYSLAQLKCFLNKSDSQGGHKQVTVKSLRRDVQAKRGFSVIVLKCFTLVQDFIEYSYYVILYRCKLFKY